MISDYEHVQLSLLIDATAPGARKNVYPDRQPRVAETICRLTLSGLARQTAGFSASAASGGRTRAHRRANPISGAAAARPTLLRTFFHLDLARTSNLLGELASGWPN